MTPWGSQTDRAEATSQVAKTSCNEGNHGYADEERGSHGYADKGSRWKEKRSLGSADKTILTSQATVCNHLEHWLFWWWRGQLAGNHSTSPSSKNSWSAAACWRALSCRACSVSLEALRSLLVRETRHRLSGALARCVARRACRCVGGPPLVAR